MEWLNYGDPSFLNLEYWSLVFCRIILIYVIPTERLQRRVEISNPITSWYRVKECVTLSNLNISPYLGDICHQPPVVVKFFQYLPPGWELYFFSILDVMTAFILSCMARNFSQMQLKQQEEEEKSYAKGTELIWMKCRESAPSYVFYLYFFNPLTVATVAALSTIIINNLINAGILFMMCKGRLATASILVAVSTHLSLYHVMLLVPVIITAYNLNSKSSCYEILKCLSFFTMTTILLLFGSFKVFDSWDFIDAVYGFVLKAPDLTPNMGLFWYFFLEMFDHFRLFFLVVYQINAFIYTIPLAITFRKNPMLLSYSLLSVITLFQSYSNVGHLSLPIAMIPLWNHIHPYTRNNLLIFGIFFFTILLAPCMWYLWIYAGIANANFFYAVTLAYSTAQVFLLSDVLYAFLRHRFHLINGLSPKTKDGKDGIVLMK